MTGRNTPSICICEHPFTGCNPACSVCARMSFAGSGGTSPRSLMKPGELYFVDNGRVVCHEHAGSSAKYTLRDISGQKVKRVTPKSRAEWLVIFGAPIKCEDCR